MVFLSTYTLAVVVFLVLATPYILRRLRCYPHGPTGLPFIGNVLDMPSSEQWRVVAQWGKKYGDVIYVEMMGQPVVYLNSAEAVTELFSKRGNIYSDRPQTTMAVEMCGLGDIVPLTKYGDRFRSGRRLMNQVLSPAAVEKWQPVVLREVYSLLQQLLDSPEEYAAHIRRMAGSTIFSTVYGYHVAKDNDPYVLAAEEFAELSSYAVTAGWLVNFIPFLKYIPGTGFQRFAQSCRSKLDDWIEHPYSLFKQLPESYEKSVSFCGRLSLDEQGRFTSGDIEEHIKWLAASMYGAGADTTPGTLLQMILALIHHPHALKKVQAEIDEVVGNDRLPQFTDRHRLPYVDCIIKEVLRWGTTVPLTPPHVLMEQDEYRGFTIPKGSFCIANMWAILHDDRLYPEPHKFDPDRFYGKTSPEFDKLLDPTLYAFGFGRRRCPGIHFADQSLWCAAALILACFDISAETAADGTPLLPELTFAGGAVRHPKPFRCKITPRRPGIRTLVDSAVYSA